MLKIFLKSPIYYHYPIYNLAHEKKIPFKVFYWSKAGIEPYQDKEMPNVKRTWCRIEDLIHPHVFLKSLRVSKFDGGMFPRISPSLWIEVLRSARNDILFFQGFSNVDEIICLLLSRLTRSRIVFRGEGMIRSDESIISRFLKRRLLSAVSYFGYSTEENKAFLKQYSASKARFMYFPTISNVITNRIVVNKERSVVVASRLVERKRIDLCLQYFKMAFPSDFSLEICGDGKPEFVAALKLLCKELKIENRVFFHGFVDQQSLLRKFDSSEWYINLADSDPSPKALIEAMGCRCKIVISHGVGTRKDIEDLPYVFVVDTDDVDESAASFKKKWSVLNAKEYSKYGIPENIGISKCIEVLHEVQKGI